MSEKIKQKIKLVQISDIHVGSRRGACLNKVIKPVYTKNLDILAITGDLLDWNVSASELSSLVELAYQVFYCNGNHERYVDYKRVLENIAKQGVTVFSTALSPATMW